MPSPIFIDMNYTITTLGSHTALQVLKGAKDERFHTLVITIPSRTSFYGSYRSFIDETIEIPSWKAFPAIEEKLLKKPAIIIPHGSFVAYLGMEWVVEAGIRVPRQFRKGDKIDRAVIVKSYGAAGGKGYFVARTQKEFDKKLGMYAKQRFIVQEYVIGVPVYIHFFYSPLIDTVELMSVDKRYETNVDSLGRIPAKHQHISIEPTFEVVGNSPLTIRESLMPDVLDMARRVVDVSKKLMPPKGLFGPFCLETIITSVEEIYLIEISARIVAGTNLFIAGSPYTYLRYKEPMSTGRRIAREIKLAIKKKRLPEILD